MAGKMWAGRFTKEVDERVNDLDYTQHILGVYAGYVLKECTAMI